MYLNGESGAFCMEYAWFKLYNSVFEKVDIDNAEVFGASAKLVPRPVLLGWAANFCLSEIYNGGLLQLFWNSTGLITPEAVEGFSAMGMPLLADILSRAAALLGEPFPREREARWDALLANSGKSAEELEEVFSTGKNHYLCYYKATENFGFDELDQEIYQLMREENGGVDEATAAYLAPWNESGK